MGFHYGFEKKKFDADWKILRKEYESAGMSDESIQAMYEFDWGVFNRRRADENKEQAFTSAMYDCETLGSEDQSTLYHKFLEELSWHDEYSFGTGRFAWIESIDDSMLYLKQKRKKNTGELEVIQVKGTHMPIVSEEEFAQVQEITAQRSLKQSGIRDNKKTVGVRPHTTVWGRLMVCQCGKRFNLHYHDRKDRSPGVDYQCYTSVNRGSHAERTKRGLSLEGTCDTPFIPGWKLEMMTKRVFRDYISNSEEILSAAALILENHINDEDDAPDYSDAIQRKRDEIAKLNKRLNNLIEMREDGDIGKEQFRERKKTLEQRLQALNEEVIELTPAPIKDDKVEFSARLAYLTKQLQKRVAFGDGAIPENVVEAFIEKIWVSKDEFRWYLRCGNNRSALKEAAHYKIASFTITFEEAKAYQYAISKRKRIYNWVDLNVSIWI